MCGIAGVAEVGAAPGVLRDAAGSMARCLAHRGPDAHAVWADEVAGIALGHRRLAVIEPGPGGEQPMVSADGSLVLVYNGELYNYRELRAELAGSGSSFRSDSDTEVVVEALARWGPAALSRMNGMFALAAWGTRRQRLLLARDALGEKPLSYGWLGGRLVFASELRAFRVAGVPRPEVDLEAMSLYLRLGYVPAPWSILRGVRKLPPGTWLEIDPARPGLMPDPQAHWSLDDVIAEGALSRGAGDADDAKVLDRLAALLDDSVRLRLVADVPLGAFLSGGVDSALVVDAMVRQSAGTVRTFTMGFAQSAYDESAEAAAVAAALGTAHTSFRIGEGELLSAVDRLGSMLDEPFADSSVLPTAVLSAHTRAHVTVALSGDGGDELFAGYARHRLAGAVAGLARLPIPLRLAAAAGLDGPFAPILESLGGRRGPLVPSALRERRVAEKARKVGRALRADGVDPYVALQSLWTRPAALLPGVHDAVSDWLAPLAPRSLSGLERTLAIDLCSYLPDDLLAKVDRASMASSLEVRVPLLDPRLVAFAWSLPPRFKVRGGGGKWALRALLRRRLPAALVDRPKTGFGVPLGEWLRGPLHEWAADLLDESALRAGGLQPAPVTAAWQALLRGRGGEEHALWAVLMLQAWRMEWEGGT